MSATTQKTMGMTRKQAALFAGIGLLVMAILAPVATFSVLDQLVVDGDAQATATSIGAEKGKYIFGLICLLIVVVMDLLVSISLIVFFKPHNHGLSQLQGWLRIIYSAIFLYAQTRLLMVLQVLETSPEQALGLIESYQTIWNNSFVIFGLHLVLLGVLAIQAGYMKKVMGILVLIAGAGYLLDAVIRLAAPDSGIMVSIYTFFGELVLMFWLLIRGWKVAYNEDQQRSE